MSADGGRSHLAAAGQDFGPVGNPGAASRRPSSFAYFPEQLDQLARDPRLPGEIRALAQALLDAGLADALSTAGVRFSTTEAKLSTLDREHGRA